MISRFKDNFGTSSMIRKLLFASSIFMVISVFFPWYRDLDARNVTSQFTGITGPLYLIGLVILGSGIFATALDFIDFYRSSGDSSISQKMRYAQMIAGLHSFFLTLLAASIYFHEQFGLGYLSTKTSLFGIYLSGFSALCTAICSGLLSRDYAVNTAYDDHQDEQNEYHHQDRTHSTVQPNYRVERKQIGFETHIKTGLGAHSSFPSRSDNSLNE